MTSAIARWHSSARPPSNALEQAYADQLEAEMQEMAIQLHKVTAVQTHSVERASNSFFHLSTGLKSFAHVQRSAVLV